MDTYSNILYVKEQLVPLSHLAHRAVAAAKFTPATCCIVGNYYSLKGAHEQARLPCPCADFVLLLASCARLILRALLLSEMVAASFNRPGKSTALPEGAGRRSCTSGALSSWTATT